MAVKSIEDLFLHPADTAITLRCPTVASTTCDLSATFDWPGLTVTRRNNLGVYGPGPALTNEDWVGSGGVTTAGAGGNFTVSGAGSLTLALPNEYEQRLSDLVNTASWADATSYEVGDKVRGTSAGIYRCTSAHTSAEATQQTTGEDWETVWETHVPAGPPTIYWYRRADVWYPTWPTREARYCWLGWERLAVPITAPSACTLTVTVHWKTYTFTDNHVTGAKRIYNDDPDWGEVGPQFGYEATAHSASWSVSVAAGAQTVHLTLVAPTGGETGYPKFEVVTSVVISGFANGAWVIGEPTLVQQGEGFYKRVLKTMEGWQRSYSGYEGTIYEYHAGIGSLHLDAAFEVYDAEEDNAGHSALEELGVRFFDYTVGAVSGLDLTTAASLTGWADWLTNCSECLDAERNDDAYYAAVRDDEDPPNVLTSGYAFDVCYPNAEAAEVTDPLEQSLGGGTANCSIRGGTWETVSGLVCAVVADDVAGGEAHGRALIFSGNLLRSRERFTKLWRRPPGETTWAEVATLDADACGHWASDSLDEVYDYTGTAPDTARRWEYGVGPNAAHVTSLGNVYTREYTAEDAVGKWCEGPHAVTDFRGISHIVYIRSGSIMYTTIDDTLSDPATSVNVSERAGTEEAFYNPSIVVLSHGSLLVTGDNGEGVTRLFFSDDAGDHWRMTP